MEFSLVFSGTEVKKITELIQNTQIIIVYRARNTMQNMLKPHLERINAIEAKLTRRNA
jgi:hypothetical protein